MDVLRRQRRPGQEVACWRLWRCGLHSPRPSLETEETFSWGVVGGAFFWPPPWPSLAQLHQPAAPPPRIPLRALLRRCRSSLAVWSCTASSSLRLRSLTKSMSRSKTGCFRLPLEITWLGFKKIARRRLISGLSGPEAQRTTSGAGGCRWGLQRELRSQPLSPSRVLSCRSPVHVFAYSSAPPPIAVRAPIHLRSLTAIASEELALQT